MAGLLDNESAGAADKPLERDWQHEFFGTWKMVSQEGFKDIIMLQGVNFIFANLAVAKGNTLIFGPSSNSPDAMMIESIGAPQSNPTEYTHGATIEKLSEQGGRLVQDTFLWIEEGHKFTVHREDPTNGAAGFTMDVVRWVAACDTLASTITVTRKADGKIKTAKFTHKRIS